MARKKSVLKEMFSSDWRNKVFALALSSVIWFMAYNAQKTEKQFECEVLFLASSKRAIVGATDEDQPVGVPFNGKISITLSGQRRDLEEFEPANEILVGRFRTEWLDADGILDMNRLDAFESLPEGCSIVQCVPARLRCEVEGLVIVKKEVQAVVGKPTDLTLTARSTVQPSTVSIICPEGAKDNIEVFTSFIAVGEEPKKVTPGVGLTFKTDPRYSSFTDFVNDRGDAEPTVTVTIELVSATKSEKFAIPLGYIVSGGFGIAKDAYQVRSFTFKGTEAALLAMKKAVAAGEVKAYVLTEIFAAQASKTVTEFDMDMFEFHGLPPGVSAQNVQGGVLYEILNLGF